jgi:hypothetical protein
MVIHRPGYHVDRSSVPPITELLRLARCFQLLESSIRLAEVGSPNHTLLLSPESAMPPAWRFPFIGDAICRRATARRYRHQARQSQLPGLQPISIADVRRRKHVGHCPESMARQEAVLSEPVSEAKFPASTECTGNFNRPAPVACKTAENKSGRPVFYERIPYAFEQGVFRRVAGN